MPDPTVILGGLVGAIIAVAVLSVVLLWLWNTTMPDVFDLKTISFWQAVKLLLIAGMLFGIPSAIDYPSDGGSTAIGQPAE